ncbi:MAG: hypothetical protein PHY85_08250 [Bacteroidales bacterium]|nr:hypothetical protein [Bacteroidales bacterium]
MRCAEPDGARILKFEFNDKKAIFEVPLIVMIIAQRMLLFCLFDYKIISFLFRFQSFIAPASSTPLTASPKGRKRLKISLFAIYPLEFEVKIAKRGRLFNCFSVSFTLPRLIQQTHHIA